MTEKGRRGLRIVFKEESRPDVYDFDPPKVEIRHLGEVTADTIGSGVEDDAAHLIA